MQFELSNGTKTEISDEQTLEERLGALVVGEHAILSDGDTFIQVARNAASVELQYGDGSTLYSCPDPIAFSEVIPIFRAFLKRSASWRNAVQWASEGG